MFFFANVLNIVLATPVLLLIPTPTIDIFDRLESETKSSKPISDFFFDSTSLACFRSVAVTVNVRSVVFPS